MPTVPVKAPPSGPTPALGWRPADYQGRFSVAEDASHNKIVTIREMVLKEPGLFIRIPAQTPPKEKATLALSIKHGNVLLGSFSVADVPFDFGQGQFYITGASLASFHQSVGAAVKPYLEFLAKEAVPDKIPITISGSFVTPVVVDVPGAVTITFEKQ